MRKRVKIGIVGCGAIGSSLARTIARDFRKQAELAALFDIDNAKSKALSRSVSGSAKLAVKDLAQLVRKSDLVIEAASAKSSWQIARSALSGGSDIMVMSVGGLLGHIQELRELAYKKNCRVFMPSGAISGIDALKAANFGKIKSVTLTTRKSPVSLGLSAEKIKKDTVIFSGSARKAVKLFPKNVNVSAVLSIAGIGPDKTRARIIACPRTNKNIHEIEIISDAAVVFTRTQNVLHPDNPKTSFLAVLSAVAVLRQIFDPIRIGT